MDLEFGALAPPLSEQLGDALPEMRIELFQRFADAITLLSIHGVMSEGETDRARRRVVKWIERGAT